MESDWYDLVTRLIEIIPADEMRRMCEIVRKANTGVRRHSTRTTVLITIASGEEKGSGYPDLPIPGMRVGRQEAWAEWVEDGVDRQELISIISDLSQSILTISLRAWQGDRARQTARVLWWEMRRRRCLRKARHRNLKDNVFRMLKRPIRQDHLVLCLRTQVQWPMIFSELRRPCILYRALLAQKRLWRSSFAAIHSVAAWCLTVPASTCSSAGASWSSGTDEGEHSVWNPFLGFCCHHRIGYYVEGILTEEELGRVARSCRFALDLLCDKSEQQAVTFSRPL